MQTAHRTVTAGTGGNPARRASAIAITALCLLLVARVAFAFATEVPGQVPFVVALFVLPLLCAIPGTRPLVARYRWPVLAAQAVATYVPFVIFGGQWAQGVAGLLAGLALLLIPGRVSWLLAGSALVADVAIRALFVGFPYAPAWSAALWVIVVFVDDGLLFFGLVRLADLVAELQVARRQFADLAVAGERLTAAEDLQAAIGGRLAGIAAMAAAARQALPGNPEDARAQLEAAAATAREAVAQARAMTAEHRRPPRSEPASPVPAAVIAPRLAWAILVVLLCGYGLQTANNVYLAHLGPGTSAALLASIVGVAALQLYHSRSEWGGRGRPRAWPLTLTIQTALAYLPFALHEGLLTGADVRLVTEASGHLPLDAELAAAQEILASAGVDVRAEIDTGPLLAAPSAALAPVLREAVTNILRHSAATACTIEASVTGGAVRLQVSNDGAADQAAARGDGRAVQPLGGERAGTGLANLTARMRAAGGRLDITRADGWFHLSAEVPL